MLYYYYIFLKSYSDIELQKKAKHAYQGNQTLQQPHFR
jgi:hypothetical protein